MPDSNIPPKARRLLRWVGAACYGTIVMVGLVGATWPVTADLDQNLRTTIQCAGYFTAVVGFVLVLSVIFHRWRMEYLMVWWATAGISAYVGIAAAVRPPSHGFLLVAAFGLFACLTLISRGVSLSIFASKTKRVSGV